MSSRFTILLLASVTVAAVTPATAQSLYFQRRTGGYSALGFAGGNFTLTCDNACGSNKLSSSGASLMLGHHFSQRLRLELGFQYQSNRDSSSNAFNAQLGAAFYLLGNLYARGGVSYHRVSVEQTSGTYDGSGGPGFSVGAGYDLHLGRTFALTPYVNFATGKISTLKILAGGTTAGTLKTLNFGVAASFIRGTWICTTAAGQRVPVTRRNRFAAQQCLDEVARRLGQTPQRVK